MMSRIRALFRTLRFLVNHPVGQRNRTAVLRRFFRWQVTSRIAGHALVVPFVNETRLLVRRGMQGATGNVYVGLHEFQPMAFLLHYMRQDDLFIDVGANIGSYTVLAAGAVGADVMAIEPSPNTFEQLQDNLHLNRLNTLVTPFLAAAGEAASRVQFVADSGTTSHVLPGTSSVVLDGPGTLQVDVVMLDSLIASGPTKHSQLVMKLDVEGYELPALKGAVELFEKGRPGAVIVEVNGSGMKYGYSDRQVIRFLEYYGLREVSYDPFGRVLSERIEPGSQTRIFVRDTAEAKSRVLTAPRYVLSTGDNV